MKNHLKFLTFFLMLVYLVSCGGVPNAAYIGNLSDLEIGMKIGNAIGKFSDEPEADLKFQVPGLDGEARVITYNLISGDYVSDYFLVFLDNNLVYWGYPHEFARHDDPKINKLGWIAVEKVYEQREE